MLKNKNDEVEKERKFENSISSFNPMIPLSSYLQRDDKNYIINKDITARKILDQHEENENRIRDKKQFQDK